jgi:AcrR family transcriptional regulator
VAKSSILWHFGSKEELLLRVAERVFEEVARGPAREILALPTIEQRSEAMWRFYAETVRRRPEVRRLVLYLIFETAEGRPELRARLRQLYRGMRELFAEGLRGVVPTPTSAGASRRSRSRRSTASSSSGCSTRPARSRGAPPRDARPRRAARAHRRKGGSDADGETPMPYAARVPRGRSPPAGARFVLGAVPARRARGRRRPRPSPRGDGAGGAPPPRDGDPPPRRGPPLTALHGLDAAVSASPAPLPEDVEGFFSTESRGVPRAARAARAAAAAVRRIFVFAAINAIERLAYAQFENHLLALDVPETSRTSRA